ncbi:MAG TPA: FG-GAP-like repeat-containing protein [Acidobacteriaceae bacterium]|nr:FG-GAP-like repeat-containing protein [Acidobacteriaceae bacterium]
MAIGDFNGDGLPDIAWVDFSTSPSKLHILMATAGGDYTNAPDITFPVTTRPPECVVADFNKDGHQDLACTSAYEFTNNVDVYLGNGDGTFQTPVVTAVPFQDNGSYSIPLLMLAGDLNGDGYPDLIEGQGYGGQNEILLGDGKGGFTVASAVQSDINNGAVFAADVNADGIPDLLLSQGPEVELGTGGGKFGLVTNYSTLANYGANCVFHDMENSGHLDAVCGFVDSSDGDITGGSRLIILRGNPDGSFNTTPISTTQYGDQAYELDGFGTFLFPKAVYDANGDGIPDVLAYAADGTSVLLGQTGLTFAYPMHFATGYFASDFGLADYQFRVADMNGDGIPDVVSIAAHGIYISYGQSDGTLATAPAYEMGELLTAATVADFNGDGVPDVASTGEVPIHLSLGKGDGTFLAPTNLSNGTSSINFRGGWILHGDFNGDHKQDLVASDSTGAPWLLFGNGDGSFQPPIAITSASNNYFHNLRDAAAVDINGDGRTDLMNATVNSTGATLIANLSNGDGSFTSVTSTVPDDAIYNIPLPSFADFNKDGKLDAVYGGLTHLYTAQGNGDGTFTPGVALSIPALSGIATTNAIATATADFDGDGNADIAVLAVYGSTGSWNNTYYTAVWVYYGNGNGGFSTPVFAGSFDREYLNLTAVDLNRDGLADLVLGFSSAYATSLVDLAFGDNVAVVNSQPGRTFGAEMDYTAGYSTLVPIVTDLNGDGYPDIVVPNNGGASSELSGNSITVLLNSGAVTGPPSTTSLTCSPASITVFNTAALTATVISTSGTPTGSIAFTDNGAALATQSLLSGAANLTYTGLVVGTHTLTATFVPTGAFGASSASCTETVTTLPSTSVLSITPSTSTYGSPVTLNATVSPATPPGPSTPTGTVTFYNGSSAIGTATLAAGSASLTLSTLPGGTDNLTCTYSGSSIYSASSCNIVPLPVNAAPTALTLTSSNNPATALTAVTFTASLAANGKPVGAGDTITLSLNGQTFTLTTTANGSATYTINTLTPNTYPVTASFAGTSNLLASTGSLTEVVSPAPTTTTLTVSPNPAYATQTVNITAAVSAQGTSAQPTTGTVTFYDGATSLGTQSVSLVSTATPTISTLAVGTHPITAVFTPATDTFVTSTSPVVNEVILASGFTIALAPGSITMQRGASATAAIKLTSVGNFAGPLSLTYGTLPTNASASINPGSVTLSTGGTASSTLSLNTLLKSSGSVSDIPTRPGSRALPAVFAAFALLFVPLGWARRKNLTRLLSLALLALALQTTTGCTNAWYTAATVAPGTYQIPVIATDVNHNTQTATLTITITP